MIKHILLAIACLSLVSSKLNWGTCPTFKRSIPSLEINRYLGHWYELGRHRSVPFQKGDCGKVFYSLNPDGTIRIENTEKRDDKFTTIIGRAFTTSDPFRLKITFSETWIGKLFKGDYQVVETDYEGFAVVYSCSDFFFARYEYVWILSRTPQVTEEKLNEIKNVLTEKLGIPIDEIRFTNQTKELCGY
jgi:lipocalin